MTVSLGGSSTQKTSFSVKSLEGDKDLIWVHSHTPALLLQLWETPWRGRSKDGPGLHQIWRCPSAAGWLSGHRAGRWGSAARWGNEANPFPPEAGWCMRMFSSLCVSSASASPYSIAGWGFWRPIFSSFSSFMNDEELNSQVWIGARCYCCLCELETSWKYWRTWTRTECTCVHPTRTQRARVAVVSSKAAFATNILTWSA